MNIIFIVGYAASGKSYLSNLFLKQNYLIISTDDIIRNNLMTNSLDTKHFLIYNDDKINQVEESKKNLLK